MWWLLFYLVWIYFTPLTDCLRYNYVMVFMENVHFGKNGKAGSIHLFLGTAQPSVCTGYVYTPLLDSNNTILTEFKIAGPNGSHFDYDSSLKLNDTGLQINTFVVESSQPLTVIGLNKEVYSSDSFLAFSTPNLGAEYFTVSFASKSGECYVACQFAIVAIDNNTNIQIYLPLNPNISQSVTIGLKTYTNGETIELTLEQYQSYEIQSDYDFTGTQVIGDKPFAMFSGNVKTNLGTSSQDHLAEQLIPVESMGRSFTVVPTPDQTNTTNLLFRVVATKGGTVVQINENREYKLNNPGDWIEISEPLDEYYSVTSNNPIMVIDFLSLGTKLGNTDPCLVMIVPTEQWQARYFYYALDVYINYFIVVIEDSAKGGLLLNGQPVTNVVWKQVKSSSLVGGYITVTESTNLLTNQFENITFAAYIYGRVGVETHCTVAGVDLSPKKVEQAQESFTVSGVSSQQDTTSAATDNLENSIELEQTTSLLISFSEIIVESSSVSSSEIIVEFSLASSSEIIVEFSLASSSEIIVESISASSSEIIMEFSLASSSEIIVESISASSSEIIMEFSSTSSSEIVMEFSSVSSSEITVEFSSSLESSLSYSSEIFSSSVESSSASSPVDVTYTTIYESEAMENPTRAPGTVETKSVNVPSHPTHLCRCGCSKINLNSTETDKIISSIQQELYVDKQKVSKSVRKKTSAGDSRSSSAGIGMVGVVFILVVLGALLVLDLPKIYRDYKVMRGD